MSKASTLTALLKCLFHTGLVVVGALGLTTLFFLVLPLMQAIAEMQKADTVLQTVTTADVPPPPAPQEQEPEEEEKTEETPPELEAPPANLDLSQLELALSPGFSEGLVGSGAFSIKLSTFGPGTSQGESSDDLFSLADLDQKPRPIYQAQPVVDSQLKKKAPATVHVVFVVDQRGKVENPVVQKSSDPAFERAALQAVKQWKFEPGKRGGKAVRFRMRVPITFPSESSS